MPRPLLLHIALGDAYGACFEHDAPSPGRPNDLSGFPENRAYAKIGQGRYTDDAQMALAVAEALVAGRTDPQGFADAFVAAWRRDPRPGYSRAMEALLGRCATGADLLAARRASDRSGAAMRAGPLGILADAREVLRLAGVQARTTHDTPAGIASAQASAMAVHLVRQGVPRRDVPRAVAARVPGPWADRWEGPVDGSGVACVHAALQALADGGTLGDVLRRAVAWTGDVDTVAAIALGAASQDPAIADDLPPALLEGLEGGPSGQLLLRAADALLLQRFG